MTSNQGGAEVSARARDLDRCVHHLARLTSAGGGLLLILGPAGIGKSTRARGLLEACPPATSLIVAATHPQLEPTLGLWTRLGVLAGSACRLDDAGSDRFAATLAMLREVAESGPTTVVIDDLHAADPDSLTLLAHLAPALGSTGVTVIATSRGADAITDELGRSAHRAIESQAVVHEMGPLLAGDVRDRLSAHHADSPEHGGPIPDEVVAAFLAESNGTPLLLEWLVHECWPDPARVPTVAEVRASSSGPSVTDRWRRVLDRVDPADREVLAVLIELAGAAALRTVCSVLAGEGTPRLLERLVAHGLIDHDPISGGISLVHPAIAEALHVLDGPLPADHHARIARTLASGGADMRTVLWHMNCAGDRWTPAERRAVALEVAAGATRRGDTRAAAEAWEIVLGAGEAPPADLLEAARAWRRAGDLRRARELAWSVGRSADPGDVALLSDAALIAAEGAEFHGDAPGAVGALRHVLDLLSPELDRDAVERRIAVLCALAPLEMTLPVGGPQPEIDLDPAHLEVVDMVRWHWVTRPDAAQPLAREAELLAGRLGDPVMLARTGLAWRLTHQAPEHAAGRRQRSDRARRLLADPRERAAAVHAVVLDALESSEVVEARVALGELGDLATATGDPWIRWRFAHTTAMLDHVGGRPHEAEGASDIAARYGAVAGEPAAVIVRLEQRTAMGLDRLQGCATVAALASQLQSVNHPPLLAGVLSLLAELERIGHRGVVVDRGRVREVIDHLGTPSAREQNWGIAAAMLASATAALGDVEAAARLLELTDGLEQMVARESGGIICLGHLGGVTGRLRVLVGDVPQGCAAIADAIERDAAAGFDRAALAGRIALLDATREHVGPAEFRRRARALAAEASARELLLLAAVAQRLGHRSSQCRLSERQREVLAGLADGLTYQAIADRIGYSHGTVRSEVTRIYAALGVDNREDALAEAEWLGLIASAVVAQ